MPITHDNPVYRIDATCPPPFGLALHHRPPVNGCFTAGTRIEVSGVSRAVEHVRKGDLVQTLDNGLQRVRSVHCETLRAYGDAAPILFESGSIGNTRAIMVSPDHRILITDWRAELLLGCDEVLVAAKDLANGRDVRAIEGGEVTYIHLAFEETQIVFAEGCAFECSSTNAASGIQAARMVACMPEAACLMAA